LAWFLFSNGMLPRVASVACYNNIFIPLIGLFNKFFELIGNVLILFGSGIVRCESTVFKCFNYIDPIYSGIHYIKSIFSCIDLDTPPHTLHYVPLNIRRQKTSTGKHLGSYFARKRSCRKRYVISGSNRSKNENVSILWKHMITISI
jgi:hypothetical protein